MTTRTDYQVENLRGLTVRTFDDPAAAHRWADANDEAYGGLVVFSVTVTTTRRRVDARGRYAPALPRKTSQHEGTHP